VLATLIVLGVCGIFGELIARMRFGAPIPERLPISRVQANRFRGWEMVPGEDHYTYQHLVEINAYGLRGAEVPDELAPGERRILALGDSMTYGQGVASDQTVPQHLERLLQSRAPAGSHWRVINAGHRAYATNQELGLLEELGARLQPEIVILFWYDNDFGERDLVEVHAELESAGPRTFDVGGVLEGVTLLKWRLRQAVRRSALAMVINDRLQAATEPGPTPESFERGFVTLEDRLSEYVRLCTEIGARPVLAVIPRAGSLAAPGPSADRERRVQAAARAHGIEVVELLPGLRELYRERGSLPTLPHDGHYLGAANERMAAAVAAALQEL